MVGREIESRPIDAYSGRHNAEGPAYFRGLQPLLSYGDARLSFEYSSSHEVGDGQRRIVSNCSWQLG